MCCLKEQGLAQLFSAQPSVLEVSSSILKLCANGQNDSKQFRDLQCIVGRIQPVRLCELQGDHV